MTWIISKLCSDSFRDRISKGKIRERFKEWLKSLGLSAQMFRFTCRFSTANDHRYTYDKLSAWSVKLDQSGDLWTEHMTNEKPWTHQKKCCLCRSCFKLIPEQKYVSAIELKSISESFFGNTVCRIITLILLTGLSLNPDTVLMVSRGPDQTFYHLVKEQAVAIRGHFLSHSIYNNQRRPYVYLPCHRHTVRKSPLGTSAAIFYSHPHSIKKKNVMIFFIIKDATGHDWRFTHTQEDEPSLSPRI